MRETNQPLPALGDIPRPEYPRPIMTRPNWLNLNGLWQFKADPDQVGQAQAWPQKLPAPSVINVPFAPGTKASGAECPEDCQSVWYERALPELAWSSEETLLHIGASDHATTIWINGQHVADHRGGYAPITVNIQPFFKTANNRIVVRVNDTRSWQQPRGKQAGDTRWPIDYDPIIGIWQTVWLEPAPSVRINGIHYRYDLAQQNLTIITRLSKHTDAEIEIEITDPTGQVLCVRTSAQGRSEASQTIQIPRPRLWHPQDPYLYSVKIRLLDDGAEQDSVESYTGLRSLAVADQNILLNGEPLYLRGILDQGYFPDGWYTATTDDELKKDIELTLELGFNLARKHQKFEDPRYLYWADQLGLMVWNEMPSGRIFSQALIADLTDEWMALIHRDQAHPCVIGWVPFNESWGLWHQSTRGEQRHFADAIYHLTKALDPTRPVITNDGWEYSTGDYWTLHLYETTAETLQNRLASLTGNPAQSIHDGPNPRAGALAGADPSHLPLLLTECGGIGLVADSEADQGDAFFYGDMPKDTAAFLSRTAELLNAIDATPRLRGFVWTQLTDVQQEINGLLDFQRQPKVPLQTLRHLIEQTGLGRPIP